MDGAKAKSIEYSFLDGKFCQLGIWIEAIESIDAFKRTLFGLFGEPNKRRKTHADDDEYTWEGNNTEVSFLCSIGSGLIQMTSTQINKAEMNKVGRVGVTHQKAPVKRKKYSCRKRIPFSTLPSLKDTVDQ